MIRLQAARRQGISLLEIVLALGLAAIAMALLTQLVGIGNRAAAVARDVAKAQIVAESIMAEVMAGVMPMQSSSGTYEQDPSWSFEVTVAAGPTQTINAVRVAVTQVAEEVHPATFTLTQWQAIPPETEEETLDTESAGESL